MTLNILTKQNEMAAKSPVCHSDLETVNNDLTNSCYSESRLFSFSHFSLLVETGPYLFM